MYITSVKIENIRSVADFRMDFKSPAGWHVLIGDNGSGKSTISKLISKNYEAKIIDADKIAKEMTKNNGEYLQAIRQAFGNDVIKNNELDK